MRFGKNGNKERQPPQMPQVQRPQIPPLKMAEDLDELRESTEQFYERRKAPLVLPMEDVATGIKDIVEQFGKRAVPTDIPKVYQDLIQHSRTLLNNTAKTIVDMVRAAEEFENETISRCRAHEDYMKREGLIAQKMKDKHSAIIDEIKAELAAEKETEGK